MVNALVLAGRANNGAFSGISGASSEALIEICGRPMLSYVLEALTNAREVERTVVVGFKDEFQEFEQPDVVIAQSRGSILENIRAGLEHLSPGVDVLIATSDIPLVTPHMIDEFLSRAAATEGDFFYPIVRKETVESKYPNVKRTYVTIRDGTFTGGNLFLLKWQAIEPGLALGETFFNARKSPLKLARLLGWSFVLRLLTRTASLDLLERRVSQLAGSRGKALVVDDPEIGIDVDKLSDLELVRSILKDCN